MHYFYVTTPFDCASPLTSRILFPETGGGDCWFTRGLMFAHIYMLALKHTEPQGEREHPHLTYFTELSLVLPLRPPDATPNFLLARVL